LFLSGAPKGGTEIQADAVQRISAEMLVFDVGKRPLFAIEVTIFAPRGT
jgi:hypothetical protein